MISAPILSPARQGALAAPAFREDSDCHTKDHRPGLQSRAGANHQIV